MDWNLTNKVVVLTGGAQGIGFEIADKFLYNGVKIVMILDIDETIGTAAINSLNSKHGNNKAIFLKCDVTTDIETTTQKIFSSHTVDVLVNSAGIINESEPRKAIDVNVTSLIELSFKFWEHMSTDKGGKGGTIINIASIYGYKTDQYIPVYHASKFAVMGFTRSLGHTGNYERSNVRVVAICPGFTDTNIMASLKIWDQSQNEKYERSLKSQIWQKADAVGNAAVEIYQKAKSGTSWEISGAQPIFEVSAYNEFLK